jgi:hypothetical protein
MRTQPRNRLFVASAVGLSLLGLAACGGDNKSSEAATTTKPTTASSAGQAGDAANRKACDTYVAISQGFQQLGGPGGDAPPSAADVKQAYASTIQTNVDALGTMKPAAVAGPLGTMLAAAQSVGSSGDLAAVQAPEFAQAQSTVDAWMFGNCGYEQASITGIDYGFQGAPTTLKPGTLALKFTNGTSHDESHEAMILRKNDGVTDSVDQLLALPEEEAMQKVTLEGGAFAPPGQTSYGFVDVSKPGNYVLVCFIPMGMTDQNPNGTGAPHAMVGMKAEFTVA